MVFQSGAGESSLEKKPFMVSKLLKAGHCLGRNRTKCQKKSGADVNLAQPSDKGPAVILEIGPPWHTRAYPVAGGEYGTLKKLASSPRKQVCNSILAFMVAICVRYVVVGLFWKLKKT